MGSLLYGATPTSFEIDDRALAHVEMVALAKLRRSEGFALSLDDESGGRTTIWISASSTLQFTFVGPRPEINRAWLDVLIDSANAPSGMRIVPEPKP